MSLIFGINLSDRIYLAADCRVSHFRKGDAKPSKSLDCINKVQPLTADIVVAAAGDSHLAGYLFSKLRQEKFISEGINTLREQIKDWLSKRVDEYLNSFPFARVCLLFGGLDRTRKKRINGKKINELVGNFQNLMNVPMQMKDAIWKGISAKPNVPNPYPELPVSDSRLFAILSDAKNRKLEVEDAEWGEYLAYGPPGFTLADVPKTLFGQLEFEQGCGDLTRDRMLLTAFVKSTAEIKNLDSVGGSVVITMVHDKIGIGLLAGLVGRIHPQKNTNEVISDVKIEGNKIYARTESGIYVQLIPFSEYNYESGRYEL